MPELPRMHPDDLARLAEMVNELANASRGKSGTTADKDIIPAGATLAKAAQLARRYQIDIEEIYADPEFFGAVERPGKHKRYCIKTADANWAAHRVERIARRPRPARRDARGPQAPAGPPLAEFV